MRKICKKLLWWLILIILDKKAANNISSNLNQTGNQFWTVTYLIKISGILGFMLIKINNFICRSIHLRSKYTFKIKTQIKQQTLSIGTYSALYKQ